MLKLNSNAQGIYVFHDQETGLQGCIAIDKQSKKIDKYNTAIGGTRLAEYSSLNEAIEDAIRLATAMTKKCMVAQIPFIGGKCVLIKPKYIKDRQLYFASFGKVIESLNGLFITGCDVGVNNSDMSIAKQYTNYITGLSTRPGRDDLAYLTALGVSESIKTCLGKLNNKNLSPNLHVAVQGVGKVGKALAEILCQRGIKITVTDIKEENLEGITDILNCKVVAPNNIFDIECDVFAPCALGGIINTNTINRLRCKVICGAANNQIYDDKLLEVLDTNNILFIPDWISNIGGTIYAAHSYLGEEVNSITQKVIKIISERTQDFISLKERTNLQEAVKGFLDHLPN